VSRYEWLLFLHVLSAFALVASLVIFTTLLATVRDSRPSPLLGISWLGSRLWDVGVLGTLVFGVWMATDIDNYDLLDGWILAALVLWVIAAGAGARVGLAYRALRDEGAELAGVVRTQQLVMIVAATLLLVDMIFKPGA
jgi:uncharacterized membrane protein